MEEFLALGAKIESNRIIVRDDQIPNDAYKQKIIDLRGRHYKSLHGYSIPLPLCSKDLKTYKYDVDESIKKHLQSYFHTWSDL